jgi:hypothetical protein
MKYVSKIVVGIVLCIGVINAANRPVFHRRDSIRIAKMEETLAIAKGIGKKGKDITKQKIFRPKNKKSNDKRSKRK